MTEIKRGIHIGRKVGSELKSAEELEMDPANYYDCSTCGQKVYMGDLGQVFYHETLDHRPMSLDG